MNIFLIVLIIAAIVLFIVGGLVEAVQFLIWVAVGLVALTVIMWAIRAITGQKQP
ncbi:hypothetical protein [Microbacterium sp. NIBRBAC000506063]|uniref:hypothetical protein n=1 Tax=Microbacterium sp. NIBRBAC000506063 TaxID=2734618 RepID=UPI001BB5C97A|nr:hypothetical protein [Microbacterium sp. NIBRBAC000506063]QTV79300.1 hypothetical protein KAE78_09790 [Microbacterium sp. NIBRBAC000506063]